MKNKTTKAKHMPMRTCIVTKEKCPKKDLIRIALVDGVPIVDKTGKARGRGANIKPDPKLFDIAISKGTLNSALKLKKKLDVKEISELKQSFVEAIEEKQFRPSNKPVTIRIHKDKLPK